jgi:lyso-ornithine lipid O-acyltransferase
MLPPQVLRVARVVGFAGVTAALLPTYALRDEIAKRRNDRDDVRDRWTRRWADGLLRVFDIRIEQTGQGDHDRTRKRGRLVISNHRSAIDVAVILRTFGGAMVSRADLSGWPLVGAAARKTGTLFVDRQDKQSGAAAIRQIRERLAHGQTVCIFPEGTTFDGDEIRPFQTGAFLAALHQHVDIIPVGLAYESGSGAAFLNETFMQHLSRMAASRGARVSVVVGDPYPVPPKVKAQALAEEARKKVDALVKIARRKVDRLT